MRAQNKYISKTLILFSKPFLNELSYAIFSPNGGCSDRISGDLFVRWLSKCMSVFIHPFLHEWRIPTGKVKWIYTPNFVIKCKKKIATNFRLSIGRAVKREQSKTALQLYEYLHKSIVLRGWTWGNSYDVPVILLLLSTYFHGESQVLIILKELIQCTCFMCLSFRLFQRTYDWVYRCNLIYIICENFSLQIIFECLISFYQQICQIYSTVRNNFP